MRYLKVDYLDTMADEPVEYYGEIDSEGWELRKVEIFRNGSKVCVSEDINPLDLAEKQIPPTNEIVLDPQFQLVEISASDFELIWIKVITSRGEI